MGNPVLRGLQPGRKQQDRRILAGNANIVRQLASVASSDETLLDSPEFVARLTRVAPPWHSVLIALTLAFDRKSVLAGKGLSVRVDLGGCVIIKSHSSTNRTPNIN